MKTAPLDKEPPFVLLPMRPAIWRKLIDLISLKRVRRDRKQFEGLSQSANQLSSGVRAASKVASGNQFISGPGAIGQNRSGNQLDYYSASLNAVSGGMIEINERGAGIASNMNVVDDGWGALAHDGSFTFFRWDNAKGCMVPYEPSTPVIQRFQRSLDAFMRSWRLG